jgi:sulfate adenylyltransferase subunit 2
MHVDTGHNFPEVIAYRDRIVAELGERLVVASVQDSIDDGRVHRRSRPARQSRNRLQTVTLLDAIASTASTPPSAAPAATRRRPAPRSASSPSATSSGSGIPRTSGPSCGTLYNARIRKRRAPAGVPAVELDRARRLAVHRARGIELPEIYFAHEREVVRRDGMLLRRVARHIRPSRARRPSSNVVRFRTVGDMTCTGAVARTRDLDEVIAEVAAAGSPSAAPPAPTTGSPRPPWKTASGRATSDVGHPTDPHLARSAALRHRRQRRRRQEHPDRPPAVRHQVHLRGPTRGGRGRSSRAAATTVSTSRC